MNQLDNNINATPYTPKPNDYVKNEQTASNINATVPLVNDDPKWAEKKEEKIRLINDLSASNFDIRGYYKQRISWDRMNHKIKEANELDVAMKASILSKPKDFVTTVRDTGTMAQNQILRTGAGLSIMAKDKYVGTVASFNMDNSNRAKDPQAVIDSNLKWIKDTENSNEKLQSFVDGLSAEDAKLGKQEFSGIEGAGDLARWAIETAGTNAANMVAIGMGFMGAGAGGAMAASMAIVAPEVYQSINEVEKETGITIPEDEKYNYAITAAFASSSLELVGAKILGGTKGLTKNITKNVVMKNAKEILSKSAIAKGGLYLASELVTEPVQEAIIEDYPSLVLNPNRHFGDDIMVKTAYEAAAAAVLMGGPSAVTTAYATSVHNKTENALAGMMEETKVVLSGKRAADIANGIRDLVKFTSSVKKDTPNISDEQISEELEKMQPDLKDKTIMLSPSELLQIEEGNPELHAKLEGIKAENPESETFNSYYKITDLVSTLTEEEYAQIDTKIREDASSFSVDEYDQIIPEEIEKRFDTYFQEGEVVGEEVDKQKERIGKQWVRQVNRLAEQSADAGYGQEAAVQVLEAQGRAIMSLHKNDPAAGIRALKRINITRNGVTRTLDIREGSDPVAYKKNVESFLAKRKAVVKTARKERDKIKIEKAAERRLVASQNKTDKFQKMLSKDASNSAKKEVRDFDGKAEYEKLDPNFSEENTIYENLKKNPIYLGSHLINDALEGAGIGLDKAVSIGIVSSKRGVDLETVISSLSEIGSIDSNSIEVFSNALSNEISGIDRTGETSTEEDYARSLVDESESIITIEGAEAIRDEYATANLPDQYIEEIENNIDKNLRSEVDRLINEREDAGDYNQQGNLTNEARDAFLKDSKIKIPLYTGTNAIFDQFSYDFTGQQGRMEGAGFYLTDQKEVAEGYVTDKGQLIEAYVNMKKPMPYDQKPFDVDTMAQIIERAAELEAVDSEMDIDDVLANFGSAYGYAEMIQSEETALDQMGGLIGGGMVDNFVNQAVNEVTGYDGVISDGFSGMGEGGGNIYVAWFPNQIKSTKAKTFDTTSDNIFNQVDQDTKNHFAKIAIDFLKQKQKEGFDIKIDEEKQTAILYHGTSPSAAKKILKNGELKAFPFLGYDKDTARTFGGQAITRGAPEVIELEVYLGDVLPTGGYFSANSETLEKGRDGVWRSPTSGNIYEQAAYHGTPHEVVKFSLDKIGTGEGAQAYGYGLYFTGEKDIAEHYRSALSAGIMATLEDGSKNTVEEYTYKGKDLLDLMEKAQDDQEYYKAQVYENILLHRTPEQIASSMESGSKAKSFALEINTEDIKGFIDEKEVPLSFGGGNTYKVDIPDSDTLLQWDAPLSQQGEILENALRKVIGDEVLDDIIELAEEEAPSDFDTEEKVIEYLTSGEIEIKDEIEFYLADAPETLAKLKELKENAFGFYLEDDNGGDLFRYIEAITDSPREASQFFNDIGVKGHEYPAGDMAGNVPTDARNFVIWDENAIEILDDAIYNQKTRGSFNSVSKLITLLDPNESTIPHEFTHAFTDSMLDVALNPDINELDRKSALETVTSLGKWMGNDGRTRSLKLKERANDTQSEIEFFNGLMFGGNTKNQRMVFHEMMSEGFEVFLAEGDAPNNALKKAFIRFADWLKDIYGEIQQAIARGEKPQLSDDMRKFFNEVMTFDSDVVAEQKAAALPTSYIKALGITSKKDLDTLFNILSKSYKNISLKKREYMAAAFKKAKGGAKAQAKIIYDRQAATPLAIDMEKYGSASDESLKILVGEDNFDNVVPSLRGGDRSIVEVIDKKKMDYGVASAALVEYKTYNDILSDIYDDIRKGIEQAAATDSVWSSPEMQEYHAVLSMMKQDVTKTATKAQLKSYAKKVLLNKRLSESTNPSRFIAAARKSGLEMAQLIGKSSVKALTEEEVKQALKMNEKMRLNMAFAEQAVLMAGEVSKKNKAIVNKSKNKEVGSRQEFIDGETVLVKDANAMKLKEDNHAMIQALLVRLGLTKPDPDTDKQKKMRGLIEGKDISDFVSEDLLYSDEFTDVINGGLAAAENLATRNQDTYKGNVIAPNINNLTGEQYSKYIRLINSMIHEANFFNKPKIMHNGKEITILDGLQISLSKTKKRDGLSTNEHEKFSTYKRWARKALSDLGSIETMLKIFEGAGVDEFLEGAGTVMFNPLDDAYRNRTEMINEYTMKMGPVLEYFTKRALEIGRKHGHIVSDPLLQSPTKDKSGTPKFTAMQVLMMGLHLGTEENYSKLYDGYGFTEETMNKILDKYLTEEDMDMFQKTWDILEELYPVADEAWYRLRGVRIGKKINREFTFKKKTYRGGYAPATADYRAAVKSGKLEEATMEEIKKAQFKASSMRSNMNPSFRKKITDVKLPLMLDLGITLSHIDDVATFVHMQESLDFIKGVISQSEFKEMYDKKMGEGRTIELEELYSSIISRDKADVFAGEAIEHTMKRFREMVFAGKASVRVMQVLGLFTAIPQLGLKHIVTVPAMAGVELAKRTANRIGVGSFSTFQEFAESKDGFMKQRDDALNHNAWYEAGKMNLDWMRKATSKWTKGTGLSVDEMNQFGAYWGIGFIDSLFSSTIWAAQYGQQKERLLSEGMSEEAAESRAVELARETVRQTQDSNRAIDIVKGQRKKGLERSLFMFSSYAIRIWFQMHRVEINKLRDEGYSMEQILRSGKNLMVINVTPVIIGAVMRAILNGDDLEDDDVWGDIMLSSFVDTLFGPIPVFGSMLSNPQFGGAGGVFNAAARDISGFYSKLGKEDNLSDTVLSATSLISWVAPVPQIIPMLKNIDKQIEKVTKD